MAGQNSATSTFFFFNVKSRKSSEFCLEIAYLNSQSNTTLAKIRTFLLSFKFDSDFGRILGGKKVNEKKPQI